MQISGLCMASVIACIIWKPLVRVYIVGLLFVLWWITTILSIIEGKLAIFQIKILLGLFKFAFYSLCTSLYCTIPFIMCHSVSEFFRWVLRNSAIGIHAERRHAILVKIASVREVVLGAPLRIILKSLGSRTVPSNIDRLVSLVHRPNESFFLAPQVKTSSKRILLIFLFMSE